jgi:predicted phosphodiesterase
LRIAVTADTHGSTGTIIKCWQKLQIDQILFAGDFYKDGKTICQRLGVPGHIIAGNCDGPGHVGEKLIEYGEYNLW